MIDDFLLDPWGNPYHKYHKTDIIHCNSCSRVISENVTQGGYLLEDGRYICSLCQTNIVESPSQIKKSKNKVLETLKEIGINIYNKDIQIILVNRNVLFEMAPEFNSQNIKGLTKIIIPNNTSYDELNNFKIYILDKLPILEFEAVLAHEYFHVWLQENNINLDKNETEGFCNLASAHIYKANGSKFAQIHLNAMDTDSDPIYGEGYRKMKERLEKFGWKILIETLLN